MSAVRDLQLVSCGLRFAVRSSRFAVRGSRFAVRGLRFAVCGLRFAVRGLRFAVCGLQRCRSSSCKGAGSRPIPCNRLHEARLSVNRFGEFFRILPQNFFFVFVFTHKFFCIFKEDFGAHVGDQFPFGCELLLQYTKKGLPH